MELGIWNLDLEFHPRLRKPFQTSANTAIIATTLKPNAIQNSCFNAIPANKTSNEIQSSSEPYSDAIGPGFL